LARDTNCQETVVLKFPNEDLISNVSVFERYKREAEIGSRLDHPHIQRLLNTDEQHSEHYLVMEFIQGKTLRELLDALAPQLLPPHEVARIGIQIGEALTYAHEHGVFHRDIKPENVMILEDGNVKLIDFGVALLEGARRVTWRGLSGTVGTPDYMSPEQLTGDRGAAGSDVYAVGAMLYEMLCGHVPFEGENVFAVLNQHVTQDPPSILHVNPHVSPALATVIMRSIRRDPEKRYKHMADMLRDLRHLDAVVPVPYHPDKQQYESRSRRILLLCLVTIAICLTIIAIGFLAQFVHNAVH
ncbi:MAG TPA: serine/threonine-protein kinase, partial [Chthonomonadales bacterium]|nr:serine/threonine-protein kinase [Chthonomonadales bacterium]